MAKCYTLFLCVWALGIGQAFAQTGCLYDGNIYTDGSYFHPGIDNYTAITGITSLGDKCPSGTQTPCKVYYGVGGSSYYDGLKSDYSNLNCPLDNGSLGFLLSIGLMGYFMIRYKLSN